MTKKIAIFIDNDFYFTIFFLRKFFKTHNISNFIVFLSEDFLNLKRVLLMMILLSPTKFIKLICKVFKNKLTKVTEKILFKKKINFYKLEDINSEKVQKILLKNNIEDILSVINSKIFRKKSFSNYNIYNLHLGKIPEYKGIVPVINAYINNEKKFFSSVFKINFTGIDNGDLINESFIKKNGNDNIFEIYEKLYDIGFDDLIKISFLILNEKKISCVKSISKNDGNYYKYPKLGKVFKFKFDFFKKI